MEPFTEHCCERMLYFLDEKKVGIYYNPIFREYFISLRSFRNAKLVIYHCPWCGEKFSRSLVDEFYSILETEFGIYKKLNSESFYEIIEGPLGTIEKYVDLPEEFVSDWWWGKRGL